MSGLLQLETDRLYLRQWEDKDYMPFAAMNADPEVMRYFPATLSREESDAHLDRYRAGIAECGWGFWAVERKIDEQFIGFVGLNRPSAELPFKPCVEIGWRLAVSAWGKGYASEAAREALSAGFRLLKFDEIVAFTSIINSRSVAVMERLGMLRDTATFAHPGVREGSDLREHYLYRISAQQWSSSCTLIGR